MRVGQRRVDRTGSGTRIYQLHDTSAFLTSGPHEGSCFHTQGRLCLSFLADKKKIVFRLDYSDICTREAKLSCTIWLLCEISCSFHSYIFFLLCRSVGHRGSAKSKASLLRHEVF